MPSCDNISYMAFNLVGEVGEFFSKIAKAIRKEKIVINDNQIETSILSEDLTEQEKADMKAELGDILWQLSGLCSVLGWNLDDVAKENIEKLASRQRRGLIDGSGDRR